MSLLYGRRRFDSYYCVLQYTSLFKMEWIAVDLKKKKAQARTEPIFYSFLTKVIETWLSEPLHTSFFIPLTLQTSDILQDIENTGWCGLLLGLTPTSFNIISTPILPKETIEIYWQLMDNEGLYYSWISCFECGYTKMINTIQRI